MITKKDDQIFEFKILNKEYEIFFAKDGNIEIYEKDNPGNTGFIFKSIETLSTFDNDLADIIDMKRSYVQ